MASTPPGASPEEVRRIIRLIDADATLREEVRRSILSAELLELPQRLAQFANESTARMAALEERLDRFAEATNRRFSTVESDLDWLIGSDYERNVRQNAVSIMNTLAGGIRRISVVPKEELADTLDEAVDRGELTETDRQDALLAHIVVRGTSKNSGRPLYCAVEVSVTLGDEDVERAARRATTVGKALGQDALPVVVTERVPGNVSTEGVELRIFHHRRPRQAA